jgi:peptidoglycan/xylan/chitin deacetylase (PgdA/CDA1 family)
VTVENFEDQVAYLAKEGLAVSLRQMEEFLAGKISLRDGSVLVTADDGFRSFLTGALPILRHYAVPAAAFVTTSLLRSNADKSNAAPEDYLSWDDLETVATAGIAIGSHAWTHQSLGRMTATEALEQAERSREILERRLGQPITAFAYPFGTLRDFNAATANALRQSRYTCAFTSQHGAVSRASDPFELPRIKVEGGEGSWMFRHLVRGGLDHWRWVDRALWRLQATDHE